MPETRVRVVGSGFTTFNYNGKPIAFLDRIQDSGQRPLGAGFEFIHPIGATHPVEIATTRALDGGQLQLSIRELWNAPVWNQLQGLAGTQNIVDIYQQLARTPQYVTCQQIIKPPNGRIRGKIYHNCIVVAIDDGDTVSVGDLSVAKTIAVAYTHSSKL